MAKIIDPGDIDTYSVKLDANGSDFLDMYIYISNEGKIKVPDWFTDEDRYLASGLIIWGECEKKPRDEVLSWINDLPSFDTT